MNLLIEKTAANKHLDIFLRIVHNISKIKLTPSYFSYIYISYQICITWRCATFYRLLKRFRHANDNRISPSWKWFNIQVYARSTWFYVELSLSWFSGFFWKKPPFFLFDLQWFTKTVLTNKKNPEHISRYRHANWKSCDKWSLTYFKSILKFCIPTMYNFAIIYHWNLLFLKKLA